MSPTFSKLISPNYNPGMYYLINLIIKEKKELIQILKL